MADAECDRIEKMSAVWELHTQIMKLANQVHELQEENARLRAACEVYENVFKEMKTVLAYLD